MSDPGARAFRRAKEAEALRKCSGCGIVLGHGHAAGCPSQDRTFAYKPVPRTEPQGKYSDDPHYISPEEEDARAWNASVERIADLEATVHALANALRPFVQAYEKSVDPGTSDLYPEQPYHVTVSLGDCRKASIVLSAKDCK